MKFSLFKCFFVTILAICALLSYYSMSKFYTNTQAKDEPFTPFTIVFATDPQFHGTGGDYSLEIERTTDFLHKIHKMEPQPKFVVFGGDMTNNYKDSYVKKGQIRAIKRAMEELDQDQIPAYFLMGNHDVGMRPTFDSIRKVRIYVEV